MRQRNARTNALFAVLLSVLFGGGTMAAPPRSSPPAYSIPDSVALLNFDEPPPGGCTPDPPCAVFNQYTGVTFVDGNRTTYPIFIGAPFRANSPPSQVLIATTSYGYCAGETFCRVLRILFDEPQSLIRISVGMAVTGGDVTVRVTGLDASGVKKAQGQDDGLCSLPDGSPVNRPLALESSPASIVEMDVAYVRCSTGHTLGARGLDYPIQIDNLQYTLPLDPPATEQDPPIFTNISPADGSNVTGAFYADELHIDLELTVQEVWLISLTGKLNGGGEFTIPTWEGPTASYSGKSSLTAGSGLQAGLNTLELTATDNDRPKRNTTRNTLKFTLALQPLTATTVDIRPYAYEVTQTIDAGPQFPNGDPVATGPKDGVVIDYRPIIPLLQGKQTLVRVYGRVFGGDAGRHVPATATMSRNGRVVGFPDMPPVSSDPAHKSWKSNLDGIDVAPAFTGAFEDPRVPQQIANLDTTWNFVIPAGDTDEDIAIDIKINNGRYFPLYGPATKEAPECASNLDWTCQHNNRLVLYLRFKPAPSITVTTVLVHATGTYTCPVDSFFDGVNYKGKTLSPKDGPPGADRPTNDQVREVFRFLNMLYPWDVEMGKVSLLDYNIAFPGGVRVDRGFPYAETMTVPSGEWLLGDIGALSTRDSEFTLGLLPVDQRCPGYYGPNNPGTVNGMSTGPSYSWSTFSSLTYGGPTSAWARADRPFTAAHELGHGVGFPHWGCEHVTGDQAFGCELSPIAHGGSDVYGTDIEMWQVFRPGDNRSDSTPHTHDFMSYGQPRWVSWYTYNLSYENPKTGGYSKYAPYGAAGLKQVSSVLAGSGQTSPIGLANRNQLVPALSVSGWIAPTGQATFDPLHVVHVNTLSTNLVNATANAELYTLVGYDALGNVALVHNFIPAVISDSPEGNSYYFRETVPLMPQLARLDLLRGGTTVVGSRANPNPGQTPTVTITTPGAGATWPAGSQQTLRWTSNSPDGSTLHARVQYSPDGGATRLTLARDVTASELTVNTDELPGSAQGILYVDVSDGMNTAAAEAGPITVQPKAPNVTIQSPAPGLAYVAPLPVSFTATAFDLQDGNTGLRYQWSADNGKSSFTETSSTLTLRNTLPPGRHTVHVAVTNSRGLTGWAAVQVLVLKPDGQAPADTTKMPLWLLMLLIVLGVAAILLILFLTARKRRTQ